MNCTICRKPVVLVPSAEERAAKTGQPASYFRDLFTEHSECALQKRKDDMSAFLAARREATKHINPSDAWALSQA